MSALRFLSLAALLATSACASSRLLVLENRALRAELAAAAAPAAAPAPTTPERIHSVLSGAGLPATLDGEITRFHWAGEHREFGVEVQHFPGAKVVYIATDSLISLADTQDDRGALLLITTLATLNYDTLEGKLQLNPETGEVLFSVELEVDDGFSDATLVTAVDHVVRTADALYPLLRETAERGDL